MKKEPWVMSGDTPFPPRSRSEMFSLPPDPTDPALSTSVLGCVKAVLRWVWSVRGCVGSTRGQYWVVIRRGCARSVLRRGCARSVWDSVLGGAVGTVQGLWSIST
eukprot:2050181-Rhodomonas_salina.3